MANAPKSDKCEEFQESLPELIATDQDYWGHPHLQKCDLCRALVVELDTIAEAARRFIPEQMP
jgi:hypothetical protein